jgi:hypothetical protein
VEFFVGTLGFEKRLDVRMGESFRWVTVAAPSASTSVALITGSNTGTDTGWRACDADSCWPFRSSTPDSTASACWVSVATAAC